MKKICLSFCVLLGFASAEINNSIIASVGSEAITSHELKQTMSKFNLSKDLAMQKLADEKIQIQLLRQFQVFINDKTVNDAMDRFLEQNQMDLEKLKKELAAEKKTLTQFREDFKKDLEKQRLFERVASMTKLDYSDEGARQFFEQHKDKFVVYSQIDVRIYRDKNPAILENIARGEKSSLRPQRLVLTFNNTNPRLISFLSQIENGAFSPALNMGEGFELYEVISKDGAQMASYSEVRNEILQAYINDQKQNFVQDYIEKARAKMGIKYIK